eukprot:2887433-Prymnesium_polylepis.3
MPMRNSEYGLRSAPVCEDPLYLWPDMPVCPQTDPDRQDQTFRERGTLLTRLRVWCRGKRAFSPVGTGMRRPHVTCTCTCLSSWSCSLTLTRRATQDVVC